MPVKITQRDDGGMGSGMLRTTVRFALALIALAAVGAYFLLR